MPSIVNRYGEQAYRFSENFIDVVIPFDRKGFGEITQEIHQKKHSENNGEIEDSRDSTTKKTVADEIVALLRGNSRLSRSDLCLALKMKPDAVQYHLNQLKKKGLIRRVGPDKGGYWDIVDNK